MNATIGENRAAGSGGSGGFGMGRALPGSHVRLYDGDAPVPVFLVVALQEDVCVRVLLDSPQINFHVLGFARSKRSCDQGAATGSCNGHDDSAIRI